MPINKNKNKNKKWKYKIVSKHKIFLMDKQDQGQYRTIQNK